MGATRASRHWRIDRWGLLRGIALLFSALIAVTALHYFVLALSRG